MPTGIYIRTEKYRKKLSKSLKGNKNGLGNKSLLGRKLSEKTKKRISKSNRGRKLSQETKNRMSEAQKGNKHMLGKKLSEKTKKKIGLANSTALKGRKISEKTKKKMSETHKRIGSGKWMLGKKHSEETKIKISMANKGEKNYFWKGGIGKLPYPFEFNNQLKERIRGRDRYYCQKCNQFEKELGYKLVCHHIDYDKQNNNLDNLISLCRNCHAKTGFNREDWQKYFNKKLCTKI